MKLYANIIITFTCILILLISTAKSQNIAENFTCMDIDSVSHTLYDYLDGDMKVILIFYTVWDELSQDNMAGVDSVWATYGPDGDSTVVILGMEIDDYTTDTMVAIFDSTYNCYFQQINQTGSLMEDYNISYIPDYFIICPDRSYTDLTAGPATIETRLTEALEACSVNDDTLDVKAISLEGVNGSICDSSFAPGIKIQNTGTTELTSLDIISEINGVEENTFNWTGALARYDFEDISLPVISPVSDGQHTYTCILVNPNSGVEENTDNNSLETDFTIYSSAETVTLEIIPDDYPEEISWYITDNNNDTLASGEDYSTTDLITENICLLYDSCYNLIMNDSYGDGFTEGGGCVAMNWGDELILFFTEAEHYDSSYTATFCVNEFSIDILSPEYTFNAYPNPTSGNLYIEFTSDTDTDIQIAVTNILGEIILIKEYHKMNFMKAELNLGKFPGGLYNISVITGSEIISKKIILTK